MDTSSFSHVRALPGSNGSKVYAPLGAGERPPHGLRRRVFSMLQKRIIRWMALHFVLSLYTSSFRKTQFRNSECS